MTRRVAGRPLWWVVGLSAFLAVVVGLGVWWWGFRTPTYHAPITGREPARAAPVAAQQALRNLVKAVDRGDFSAAAALGTTPTARHLLRNVARNGHRLGVTGFSLRYLDQAGGVTPDGVWPAYVHATWRFAGFDRRPESLEIGVRFGRRDRTVGTIGIAGIGGGDRRSPLWMTAPLRIRRTVSTLVLVDGSAREAGRIARLARSAVPQVREVLPRWRGRLVVEVPANATGLRRALHAKRSEYAHIAAVTTTPDGSTSRSAPVHVFLNPPVFLPLKPRGAQVVLTHETTHVATGGATSPAPIWLVEGFADYVALHAQRIPLATSAARISALVRHGHLPARLPTSAELAANAPHLEARYESAWLACRLLARDGGRAPLVSFYRAVDAGRPLAAELEQHFGLTVAGLTKQWRVVLSHLPS